jgi:thrombospondin type 3 repeat protein
MREARGHARTRALVNLVGLTVLIGIMTAVFPAVSDARLPDSDGDGLSDRVETRRLHTNPRKADTDRDKLRDGVEAHVTRTNPRRMDTDHDGLTDGFEVKRSKTKPRRFDTDGDRTGDGLELLLGRDPLVSDGKGRKKPKLIDDPVPPAPDPDPVPLPDPLPPPVVDVIPPETTITSGPSGTVASRDASFTFASSEPGATFECRLDATAWVPCSSPRAYSGLDDGAWIFAVRATDAAGNTDPTPAIRTWTVTPPPSDTTAPDTTISSGPSGTSTSSSASFAFSSSEAGSTFQCRLDAGSWGTCTSPKGYSNLANGSHTFDVRATDAAGNTDATPASRTWTVNVPPPDTTAPDTTISGGPSGTVTSSAASFTFTATETGSTFQCRLDVGAWGSCTSPKAYSGLGNGSHTFDVRATDAAANTDATPASRTWTVNVAQPDPGLIQVSPGANLTNVYNQAAPGSVIELGCGNYAAWDTPDGATKQMTVRAGTRNCAKFPRLHAKSSNVTFDGIDIDAGGGVPSCAGGECAAFEAWGGNTNITFKNGRIGHVGGQKGLFLHGVSSTSPQGIVIQNTEIHDVRVTASGQHLECVMSHSPGVTFRGNTFRNCGVFDISLGRGDWWGQPEYGNVTMENNLFGHSVDDGSDWHYYGLAWWLTTLDGARIVNNTFENEVIMDRANGGVGGVWANNIGGGWTCEPGVVYAGNVGKSCSAQDKAVNPTSSNQNQIAPMGWLNPAAFDFHLTAASPAVNAGSAQYAPAADREGKARNGAPDAGAYEF